MISIKEQLKNISRRIKEYEDIRNEKQALLELHPEEVSIELSLHSLNAQINSLIKKKKLLLQEAGIEELDFRLHGFAVDEGIASIKTIGLILVKFQEFITKLSAGSSLALRGPVRRALEQTTQLHMTEVYPGSFGFKIVSNDKQADLMPEGDVMHKTIERLFQIFSTADAPDEITNLTERISIRTIKEFSKFINFMSEKNLSFDVKWLGKYNEQREWIGTPERLNRLLHTLKIVEEFEISEETKIGYIVSADADECRFKFREEVSNEILSGTFKEELRDDVVNYFYRKRVKCVFEKTTIRNMVPAKTSWVIVGISHYE